MTIVNENQVECPYCNLRMDYVVVPLSTDNNQTVDVIRCSNMDCYKFLGVLPPRPLDFTGQIETLHSDMIGRLNRVEKQLEGTRTDVDIVNNNVNKVLENQKTS